MGYKSSIKNWEGLAQRDALWSILTDDQKKGGKWSSDSFFDSGKREVEAILEWIQLEGISIDKKSTALDFGCGAGRLSRALLNHFQKVTGVDASPTMVQIGNKANTDYSNQLQFVVNQSSDLSQFKSGSFSMVFTTIVLQHIPYPQSLKFIKEFIRILEPSGLAVFQIPTEDRRQLSTWQKLKSALRIRERLALLGIGKGFHMDMHTISSNEIEEAIKDEGGNVVLQTNTNHTEPAFNGNLKFLGNDEVASGFISKLFVVRKA